MPFTFDLLSGGSESCGHAWWSSSYKVKIVHICCHWSYDAMHCLTGAILHLQIISLISMQPNVIWCLKSSQSSLLMFLFFCLSGVFCLWICSQNCYIWKGCWISGPYIFPAFVNCEFTIVIHLSVLHIFYRLWSNTTMQQLLQKLEIPWMVEVSRGFIGFSLELFGIINILSFWWFLGFTDTCFKIMLRLATCGFLFLHTRI